MERIWILLYLHNLLFELNRMTDKPNYYAVIPAEVRYSEQLSPQAKLIYAEITALCNAKGFCYASNKYFADLYQISVITVSRLINQLIRHKFIDSELIRYRKRKLTLKGGINKNVKPNIN